MYAVVGARAPADGGPQEPLDFKLSMSGAEGTNRWGQEGVSGKAPWAAGQAVPVATAPAAQPAGYDRLSFHRAQGYL